MNLTALSISHAVQRRDARVTADRKAGIDRLDVSSFRKDFELHVSVGQRVHRCGVRRRA